MLIHLNPPVAIDHFDEGRTRARMLGEVAMGLYPDAPWQAVEARMANDWTTVRGNSPLNWADVRGAAHAAWQVAKLEHEGRLCDDAPVFKAA